MFTSATTIPRCYTVSTSLSGREPSTHWLAPSGSGKSTIAKLIASFWDVGSGSITVGGVDIRHISAEHYHKLVAYVSQDNFLFDNTVLENIRMGNPYASDAEVEQAVRDCGCYDFIMSLENGFDTVVGSGGGASFRRRKQRISIARAMLKNAPIVILDEATAYTDPENEAIIQESVARLVRGKTLIVIAHRLSTIVDADQIVVVNDGHIEATERKRNCCKPARCMKLFGMRISHPVIAQKEVLTVLEILRKFFRFCDERERSEFYRSIVLGVLAALFFGTENSGHRRDAASDPDRRRDRKNDLAFAGYHADIRHRLIDPQIPCHCLTDGRRLLHHCQQARADCRASALSAHGLF